MRSKTSIEKCGCIHCQEKQEQVKRSRVYWSKMLETKLKNWSLEIVWIVKSIEKLIKIN